MGLTGQTVLVSGAARGYGVHVCRALAAAGATVGVLGRDQAAVEALAGELEGVPLVADVLATDTVQAAVATLTERTGRVDVLVNNAGVGGPLGLAWEVDPDDWWTCVEVNLRGTYEMTRAVLPGMIAAGSGRVVNVVSNAGVARWPMGSSYAVSKAAVIKYGENLAAEVRRHGIGVVNYHPGLLEIGLTATLFESAPDAGSAPGRVAAWFREQIADGRALPAEQSADLLVRLAELPPLALSGRYVTAYDDLDDVLSRADRAADALTLGLLRGDAAHF